MKIFLFSIATAVIFCTACNSNSESPSSQPDSTQTESTSPKETTAITRAIPATDLQIKWALLAAPEEKRDGAAVYGYGADTQLVLLKKGTNEMICVADDPKTSGLSVACYVKELEPFMQRGRELRKQGIKDQELFDQREKEVKENRLQMPKQPATLYVYSAKDADVDPTTGEVKNGYLRYVIYIPYATAASTGLPEKPSAGGVPWIMHAGTHAAHIMINP
jgi:hypothetical protein